MITPRFDNTEQATEWALRWLRDQAADRLRNAAIEAMLADGYTITRPEDRAEWMACTTVHERFAPHLSPAAFHQRLHHARAPLFAQDHGPTGRLVRIIPTPALIAWLGRPIQAGKRSDLAA